MALPEVERHGPIEAWITTTLGFPKQGRHSVGVARQTAASWQNCQVAVSLSIANHDASLPVAYRARLGEGPQRPAQGGCSQGDQLQDQAADRARAAAPSVRGRPPAGRGADGCRAWRRHRCACERHDAGIVVRSRHHAEHHGLGVRHGAAVAEEVGHGPPPKLIRRDARHRPNSVKALAHALPANAWRKIKWREGSTDWLSTWG